MMIHIVITDDFPEGAAKKARIKAYAKGLTKLGCSVVIEVGFSSRFNETGINRLPEGQWQGIPYRFLCGYTEYRSGRLQKLIRWWKANRGLPFSGDIPTRRLRGKRAHAHATRLNDYSAKRWPPGS